MYIGIFFVVTDRMWSEGIFCFAYPWSLWPHQWKSSGLHALCSFGDHEEAFETVAWFSKSPLWLVSALLCFHIFPWVHDVLCFCFLHTATEFRSFLLYYPVILYGILPDHLVAHLLLLSKAMRILLWESISQLDLNLAQELLDLFGKVNKKYYGKISLWIHWDWETTNTSYGAHHAVTWYMYDLLIWTGLKNCTLNFHLLSHLPHYVQLYDPLWTHSAFPFEDAIGHTVDKSHGTRDIINQVIIDTSVCYLATTKHLNTTAGWLQLHLLNL